MFVLELLGTLSLRADTGSVPLAARQTRSLGLLAVLALGSPRGLSRHRIEAFLWPNSSADRARHALDQAVYAVRRALGSDVIVTTGQELRLNSERVRVDVWDFDDALAARDWAAVVGIYKGPLLDGFHFGESHELEAWIEAERARLLLGYRSSIERLADACAEAGDLAQHVTWRRTLASSDPLSAGATTRLMLALAAAGDRAGAVDHARRYQEVVRQELQIEPDAEVEALVSTFIRDTPVVQNAVSNGGGHAIGPTVETAFDERPHVTAHPTPLATPVRARWRAERPRIVAVAAISIIAIVVIGALTVNGERPNMANLSSSVPGSPARRGASSVLPAAREAYLRGLTAWDDRTKGGTDDAVVDFRRATQLDPQYAEAYAGLAEAYVRIGYFGYRPADAMFPKAKSAALRAIELDSTLASPRTALATELVWEHDFVAAEAEYRRAVSLDSMNASAHQWYGVLLMILGRVPESVSEVRRAAELRPLDLQIQNNYATFLGCSGDHIGALRQFQKTVGEEPDSAWVRRNPWVQANMARAYADMGQYGKAVRLMDGALQIVPTSPRALYTMAVIYDEMGQRGMAAQAFARADRSNEQYAAYRGIVYADQGEADSAFVWFGRQEQWGIQPMLSLQADRRLDRLRADPRFHRLLIRLGIARQ